MNAKSVLIILGLCIGLMPLYMSSATMDPVLVPRFILLAIGVLVCSLLLSVTRARMDLLSFPGSKLALPFYLFLLSGSLAITQAINPAEVIFTISRDLLLFLFLLLMLHFSATVANFLKVLLPYFVVGSFIITGFGIIQSFQVQMLEGELDSYLVSSTLAHRNLAVSAMVLFLPFLSATVVIYKKFWRYAAAVLLLCSVFLIFYLGSRTGMLALLLMVCSAAVLYLIVRKKWRIPIRLYQISCIILLVLVLAGYGIQKYSSSGINIIPTLEVRQGNVKDYTIHERLFLWEASGRMIRENSIAGVGPGQWRIHFPKYGSDIYRSRQGMVQFQRPHNDFIWILAEQGIMGLLAFLGIFMVIGYCCLRLLNNPETSKAEKHIALLFGSGIMAYAVVAFFSFPGERIIHQILLYSYFAIILGTYLRSFPPQRKRNRKVFPVAVLLSGLLLWVGIKTRQGENSAMEMLKFRASSDWIAMRNAYLMEAENPVYSLDPISLPLSFYGGLAELNTQQYENAVNIMLRAYKQHPYNVHILNNLANAYLLKGEFTPAVRFYKEALEVSPKYRDAQLNLSAALFNNDKVGEAYEFLAGKYSDYRENALQENRYRTYMLIILKVMRDNLAAETRNVNLQQKLNSLNEAELWKKFKEAIANDKSFTDVLLKVSQEIPVNPHGS